MSPVVEHPLRYAMSNELHARPFPIVTAPSHASYLAIKPAVNAAGRDRDADMAHLLNLLDRYGAEHPQVGATHYSGQIGRHQLKWESHTEFVTYTIFGGGDSIKPFEEENFGVFPKDWLDAAVGTRLTSALIRVDVFESDDKTVEKTKDWFVPESLAISKVLDDQLVIAGDFHIDQNGHTRFAVFPRPSCGDRRIGRVIQRLCEIETYKSMAMLGLNRARELGSDMGATETTLNDLSSEMRGAAAKHDEMLEHLLAVSAELENSIAQTSFRFGATEAYETIVNQRIEVLREDRFLGMQTFSEFMMRRFDPAMRTVKSTQKRLKDMSERALRVGNLLRTRVDVERSMQNQLLLESMDRRAGLQLRLQHTVEGLSVVAISYYAVNLALYMLAPLEIALGVPKFAMAAFVTPAVLLLVWYMVRRIHDQSE
ncbi:DUF3422-family protein [Octadecabacter antarcticus 307]|uniref:DUF3422-family protein n=1 Tax=Octadecabacter antarcticus 307 TaxID=391626 RepID=M9RAA5_9RHOB|nr:DUF3422 domain-containing protein [Octadecabacter antarcticus]AGI69569.1 DUF3422-family protein [Octadecabacter antarcticus 307]